MKARRERNKRAGRLAASAATILGLAMGWWLAATPEECPDGILGAYSLKNFAALAFASYFGLSLVSLLTSRASFRVRVLRVFVFPMMLVAIVGLVELTVVLRFCDFREVFFTWTGPFDNPNELVDRELVFIHRPNSRFQGEVSGELTEYLAIERPNRYRLDIRYDDFGFRNNESTGHADIVLCGDSFIEGLMVSEERLLVSSRLAEELDLDVLNLGHAAYGPQQESIVLHRYGLDKKPRIVVWALFEGNDVTDFARYERWQEDWARTMVEHHGFLKRSFAVNLTQAARREFSCKRGRRLLGLRSSGTIAVRGEYSGERMFFWEFPDPLRPDLTSALDGTIQTVRASFEACRQRDIHFLLVLVPTKERVYLDLCRFERDSLVSEWKLSGLPEYLRRWSADVGIPFLDLTDALVQQSSAGTLTYLLDDIHWTPEGHATAARSVAATLRARGWTL